jgi:hypothetical protein
MPGDLLENAHAALMCRVKTLFGAVHSLQTQRADSRSATPGAHGFLITGFRFFPGLGGPPLRVFSMRTPEGFAFPGSDSLSVLELPSASGIRPADETGADPAGALAFFMAHAHLKDRQGQILSLCDRHEELKLAFYELPKVLDNPDVKGLADYMAEIDLQNAERVLRAMRDGAADEREAQLRMDMVLDMHRAGLPLELIISISRLPSDDVYAILSRRGADTAVNVF